MSTTHHMKMAKASQADIDAAIQLHQFLRAMSQGRSAPEVVDEFGYTGYGDLLERQAPDVEFALRAYENGDLFRVVWGMQTLLDPRNEVVDPNLPHLELHPKHEQAARELEALCKAKNEAVDERNEARAEVKRLTQALEGLRGRCSQQRADLLSHARTDPAKAVRTSCAAAAGALGTVMEWVEEATSQHPAEKPKPVAWPHLPEVDRPASEVQP